MQATQVKDKYGNIGLQQIETQLYAAYKKLGKTTR